MSDTAHKNDTAGRWTEGSDAGRNIPSNTNDVVGLYTHAGAKDTQAAIAAVKSAFLAWSRTSPQVRHDALAQISQEIMRGARISIGNSTRRSRLPTLNLEVQMSRP